MAPAQPNPAGDEWLADFSVSPRGLRLVQCVVIDPCLSAQHAPNRLLSGVIFAGVLLTVFVYLHWQGLWWPVWLSFVTAQSSRNYCTPGILLFSSLTVYSLHLNGLIIQFIRERQDRRTAPVLLVRGACINLC